MKTIAFDTAFVRVPIAGYQTIDKLDWASLKQLAQNPAFLESLYLASPSLYEEAIKLDFSRQPDEKTRRIYYSLIKYLSRYATRCTPFGLFGGFATLPITTNQTQVNLQSTDTLKKVTRLDMNYLCALAQDLEKHPDIKPHLRFFSNSSLYEINDQYRYVACRYREDGSRVHHLSSAEKSVYLDCVLTKARLGAQPRTLIDALMDMDIDQEDATGFVEQVIDNQLVVSDLEPAITGGDSLDQILHTLETIQEQHPSKSVAAIIALLISVKKDLMAIEQESQTYSIEKYAAIEQKLAQLSTPYDRKTLFQIDTYLPNISGQLNRGLLNKLVSKIPTLLKLTPFGEGNLGEFRRKFQQKYEDEEIPLVLALDPELGIGYPAYQSKSDVSPLVDGILESSASRSVPTYPIPPEHAYLLQKVAEAQISHAYQIDISEDDLRHMEIQQPYLPLTSTAMFSVITENGREKLVLNSFDGLTGTYLLGRFGHTDPSVRALLQEISQAEDEAVPNVIFADIIHLPESRTGNIIIRPQLKAYQIAYLGKASVDQEHTIPVNDLLVRVRGNQIQLRSRSLNKQIIPRLSTAHNYAQPDSLDIYHFLCALQADNTRSFLGDVTGSFSSLFVFKPRIVLDNLILAEASWNCQSAQIKPILAAFKQNDWPVVQALVASWRTHYQIPRYICLIDSDNELYVDLENQWFVETFLNEVKSKAAFRIKEFLYRAENAVTHSDKGWHTSQFAVAFKTLPDPPKQAAPKALRKSDVETKPATRRQFSVGSEWLYYKIYTGQKTADTLLVNVLYPLIERVKSLGWVDKFFFIRYGDPDWHIRLRLHFTSTEVTNEVIKEMHTALLPYLTNKSISNLTIDTYNRELERYGENSIDAMEDYFHIDSQNILQFISMIEGAEGEECRWRAGLKMTDDLLNLFGFDLKQKIAITAQNTDYFGKEFGYNQLIKKQLDNRYKEIEAAIQEVVDEANEEHQFLYDLCQQLTSQLVPFANTILTLDRAGDLQMPIASLLGSLIHMNINRLFRQRQRFVEYSVYYHLNKYYRIQYGRTMLAGKKVQTDVAPCYS